MERSRTEPTPARPVDDAKHGAGTGTAQGRAAGPVEPSGESFGRGEGDFPVSCVAASLPPCPRQVSPAGNEQETVPPPAHLRSRPALDELRRRIAGLEGRLPSDAQLMPVSPPAARAGKPARVDRAGASLQAKSSAGLDKAGASGRVRLGVPEVDRLMACGAGLALGALHEIGADESRDCGALSGLGLAFVAAATRSRLGHLLWVCDPMVRREAGLPHAPGLWQFGLDPARIILVLARRPEEALWAMEEGARCPALAAVVGEFHGFVRALDLTASRRLSLRAQESGVPVFLLRHGAAAEPGAALTRWRAAPAASGPVTLVPGGNETGMGRHPFIGLPRWRAALDRNREGSSARLTLEWSHAASRLAAPAASDALVSATAAGPDPAAAGGELVAFPGRRTG